MANYQYKARDKFGESVTGQMSANSESAVAAKLKEMGYIPVLIQQAQKSPTLTNFLEKFRKPKLSDINMLTGQFAVLQKAGLPVLLSLRSLRDEVSNNNLKEIIGQIMRDIEAGSSLSSAFEKFPAVFSPLYINMIKSGEVSGTLGESLERLRVLGEFEEKVNLRIKMATRYPTLVILAIIIGFLVLTTLVVPRFAQIFSQFSATLPLPTRILLWLNLVITKYWWLLIICAAILIFGFYKFINTKRGRTLWDSFKLKIPIFGPLVLKMIMSRFTRLTGSLMQSGVGLFEILELASTGVGNVIVSRTIDSIKKSVSEGKGLSGPMKASGMFSPIVLQMVSVGEQTGKLDELLLHVSDYYDAQVDYSIANLTSLIEPILIFILGCAVLFMALGIFLPVWNLMNLFKR